MKVISTTEEKPPRKIFQGQNSVHWRLHHWEEQNGFEGRKPKLKASLLPGGICQGQCFLGGHHIKAEYLLSEVPGFISNGSRAWHHYSCGTDFAGMESVRLVES